MKMPLAFLAVAGCAILAAGDENPDALRERLRGITLEKVQFENRPLGEALTILERDINARLDQRLPFRLDRGLATGEPAVTCSLTGENADTVLEFITLRAGYAWTLEKGAVVVFTTNAHQARWRRDSRVPERAALRGAMLRPMNLENRGLEDILRALAESAQAAGLDRLHADLPRLEFVSKMEPSAVASLRLSLKLEGCSVDDVLELLTIRAPGYQWTLVQGAVVSFYRAVE